VRRQPGDVLASKMILPAVGRSTPVTQLKNVDLPRTVRADDRPDLTRLDGDGDVVERGKPIEAHRQAFRA